jgi:hypothetical protein
LASFDVSFTFSPSSRHELKFSAMERPFTEHPCELAFEYLGRNEVEPISNLLPGVSPRWYIPKSRINALLAEEAAGVKLEDLFLCPCGRCIRDGGGLPDRSPHFNKLKEQELRTDYATIYALLIYLRRPGLISLFQRHELKLVETRYLQKEDFGRLSKEKKDNFFDFLSLQKKVVRDQYSFHVRTLKPYSDIKVIPAQELLPIKEDPIPKGEGSFAVVRCFEFQHEEYRSKKFGDVSIISIRHHARTKHESIDYKICAQSIQEWRGQIFSQRMV